MHDPFDDNQPQPKSVSTISILIRSRLVTSVLILTVIPVTIFLLVCFGSIFREAYKDHEFYRELMDLLQAVILGSVIALAPILWFCLRRIVKSLPMRVFLGCAICHLAGVVIVSVFNSNPWTPQNATNIVYVAISAYMYYIFHGLFLSAFIRITRLNLFWSGSQNKSQFVILDWLCLTFVVAAIVGDVRLVMPGLWFSLTMLLSYAILCCLASALLTLALGCFFSQSKSVYRYLFISVMLTIPLLFILLSALGRDTSVIAWLAPTVSTYAYTLTVMLIFPILRPR